MLDNLELNVLIFPHYPGEIMDNKIKCSKCREDRLESDFYIRKESGKRRRDCNSCCVKRSTDHTNSKKPNIEHNYEIIDQQYKRCSRCNLIKLGKFFHRAKANKDGIASHCKECDSKYSQDRTFENNKNRYSEEELKQIKSKCRRCLAEKSLNEFGRSHNVKTGFGSVCKACSNIETQRYRESKDGKFKYYSRIAKERGIKFLLTEEQFLSFWQKPCRYCGSEIKTIGLDRFDNKSGYTIDNAVPCCTTCNKMKLTLEYNDWIFHIKKIINNVSK